eukprot:21557-Heterococcus_DN1.PRE.2
MFDAGSPVFCIACACKCLSCAVPTYYTTHLSTVSESENSQKNRATAQDVPPEDRVWNEDLKPPRYEGNLSASRSSHDSGSPIRYGRSRPERM